MVALELVVLLGAMTARADGPASLARPKAKALKAPGPAAPGQTSVIRISVARVADGLTAATGQDAIKVPVLIPALVEVCPAGAPAKLKPVKTDPVAVVLVEGAAKKWAPACNQVEAVELVTAIPVAMAMAVCKAAGALV